jgi:hypothetical protein
VAVAHPAVFPAPATDIFQFAGKEAVVLVPIPSKFSVTALVFVIDICPLPVFVRDNSSTMVHRYLLIETECLNPQHAIIFCIRSSFVF